MVGWLQAAFVGVGLYLALNAIQSALGFWPALIFAGCVVGFLIAGAFE